MRVVIGRFTTCDRKRLVDGQLSNANYRPNALPSACLLSWLCLADQLLHWRSGNPAAVYTVHHVGYAISKPTFRVVWSQSGGTIDLIDWLIWVTFFLLINRLICPCWCCCTVLSFGVIVVDVSIIIYDLRLFNNFTSAFLYAYFVISWFANK